LTPAAITSGGRAVGLGAGLFQERMVFVPVHRLAVVPYLLSPTTVATAVPV
jgi:hypothetical protein